jgi:hypothetical protein
MSAVAVKKTGNKRLEQLELDIEMGIRSIGKSLMEIRDTKAYGDEHDTFESYCKDRWGFTDRHARNLIDAEKVRAKIGSFVPVENLKEAHLIELSKLPEKEQAQVAAKVIEQCESENREPTAKDFRKAVKPKTGSFVPVSEPEDLVYKDVEDEPPTVVASNSPEPLAANINAVGTRLDGIIKDMEKLADERGGEWIDLTEIRTQAATLKATIRSAAFWVYCPDCGGKGCQSCKHHGWLSRARKPFLTQSQKDKLGI